MIKSGHMDFYFNMLLSNLGYSNVSADSVIRQIKAQKSFKPPVEWFVKNIVHDKVQAGTVQDRFQVTSRKQHEDRELEPVEQLYPQG